MTDTKTITPRYILVDQLVQRDGLVCQHPDCEMVLDLSVKSGRLEPTIDHWYPKYWCRLNGWTEDAIWELSNLKLMHKKCNAAKGDAIPIDTHALPERTRKTFRYRRDKRATRPSEPCAVCDNGHNLFIDEVCAQCGCDAQCFPRSAKVKAPDCDHALTWCWSCSIGLTPRMGATEMLFLGGEGGSD